MNLLAVFLLPVALLLCQCASTQKTNSATMRTSPAALVASGHWVQVSKRPPTFYPRGVSADCKTDCNSGEWVYAGDAAGSRFFIPLHDLGDMSRKTLVNEALAARSKQVVDQIAAEDRAYNAKRLLFNSVFIPIYAVGSAGGSGVSSHPRKKK